MPRDPLAQEHLQDAKNRYAQALAELIVAVAKDMLADPSYPQPTTLNELRSHVYEATAMACDMTEPLDYQAAEMAMSMFIGQHNLQ